MTRHWTAARVSAMAAGGFDDENLLVYDVLKNFDDIIDEYIYVYFTFNLHRSSKIKSEKN